jgi:hypothetical protein
VVDFGRRPLLAARLSRRVGGVPRAPGVLLTRSDGGGLNFHIPLIGTEIKLSKQNTHEIAISTVPRHRKGSRNCATATLTTFS